MDPLALEDLYRRHAPAVLRRARALLRDEQASRDAMHEVFLKAWHAGDSFRHDSSPVTWLYRITTNYCLNLLRDGKRREELLREHVQDEPLAAGGPERVAIAEIFATIPDELHAIAFYYFVDQMNHDEIAAMVGGSRRTIGNRIAEIRRRFEHHAKAAI